MVQPRRLLTCFASALLAGSTPLPAGRRPWDLSAPTGWPGPAASTTWTIGHQPRWNEFFVNASTGHLETCANEITVLADTANGWPGQCQGVEPAGQPHNISQQACRQGCVDNAACTVWQWTMGAHCNHGTGSVHDCWNSTPGAVGPFAVIASQRLQRGQIRVVKDMSEVYVDIGMKNYEMHHASDSAEGTRRCRNWCRANIKCQYWQYISGVGCEVDDPDAGVWATPHSVDPVRYDGTHPGDNDRRFWPAPDVPYPLLASGLANLSASGGAILASQPGVTPARLLVAGEFIVHYCGFHPEPTFWQRPSSWYYVAGAAAALLAIALAFYCCLRDRDGTPRKKKTKRALQVEPEQESRQHTQESLPLIDPIPSSFSLLDNPPYAVPAYPSPLMSATPSMEPAFSHVPAGFYAASPMVGGAPLQMAPPMQMTGVRFR